MFDSGLGGLTAVRVLRQLLPDENIVYFGDTGRMPYGGRSRAQIREISRQNIAFAESFNVKAILAACGTISSNAPDILAQNETKAVGVLIPGVTELAETGKSAVRNRMYRKLRPWHVLIGRLVDTCIELQIVGIYSLQCQRILSMKRLRISRQNRTRYQH